ncbi:reverse gyrase [Caldanaerobacter subterraneus KAk]|uniref:reverse gyrase n=1 Tax=Caldanaerobacter subterraneus TaxID=911092 RepID=UPI0032C00D5D
MALATGAKYYHSCINCGGINTDTRNEKGLPCEVCLPFEDGDILKGLKLNNSLKGYEKYWNLNQQYKEFEEFFFSKINKKPTGYQRFWAKRLLLSKSFTLVAPTGVGKTTFGLISALWIAKKGGKVALVFPTVSLVEQAAKRLIEFSKEDEDVNILFYTSSLKKKKREKFEKNFSEGNYDILVISSQFISKRKEQLSQKVFDLVFVDDVDAVLKSSKNIDTLLNMIGISQKAIDSTLYNLKKGNNSDKIQIEEKAPKGRLIVSSATAKPKGIKPLLFRELLGFEIGRFTTSARNIANVRIKEKSLEKLLYIINLLKDGILLFVPTEEEGKEIANYLEEHGVKLGKTWEDFEKSFEKFKEGSLQLLCGIYSYYGKLVRGIDLPLRIKFAVFWGTPSFKFSTKLENAPRFILERNFQDYLENNPKLKAYFKDLQRLSTEKLRKSVEKYISPETWEKLIQKNFPTTKFDKEKNLIVIPDVYTYIQASGRTSRIFGTSLTKGISILFEEDDSLFELLKSRLLYLTEEEWTEEGEIEHLVKEAEETRKAISTDSSSKDMKSRMIIVESPTKAQTISKFLEKSSTRRYGSLMVHESITQEGILLLTASKGHLYDLETKTGLHGVEINDGRFIPYYNSIKRCSSCGAQFTDELPRCPYCNSDKIDDKKKILEALRDIAMEVDEVIIATDPDVEGEKIGWDISQYIKPVNKNVQRIEMHEITKFGFDKAIRNRRNCDVNLVKSQIVRRIEDRWVGFELSLRLQKNFQNSNLSAGRVQSTVLGWILEKEIEHSKSKKTVTQFTLENGFKFEVDGKIDVDEVEVEIVEEKEHALSPLPPFNTPSLLTAASQQFKLPVQQIMEILQTLFELGFITYHRTDSTRISSTGQKIARSYLEKIGKITLLSEREWGKEGAHEAIRPVKPISPEELSEFIKEKIAVYLSPMHIKVYSLIFNRFMASQMIPPVVINQKILIKNGSFQVEKEVPVKLQEEGWNIFNPITVYTPFEEKKYSVVSKRTYTTHTVPLFTQASLIEEMQKRNIGRPSTYAKIVDILFKRKYIIEDVYKRLRTTALGRKVYSYLAERYMNYINEETTRQLEKLMESVETGEKDYQSVLKDLYEELNEILIKN